VSGCGGTGTGGVKFGFIWVVVEAGGVGIGYKRVRWGRWCDGRKGRGGVGCGGRGCEGGCVGVKEEDVIRGGVVRVKRGGEG